MIRIVLLSALAAVSVAQQFNSDPKTAAILAEERYLSVNGQFGAAYQQEDGVQFKEESDADGTRRGSYSYVDPSGQRRTVNYVAGKNGFQPVGDHIPAAPAPVTNPLPQYNAPAPASGPAPQQPRYNPPAQYGVQEDDGEWIDDTKQEYPANSPATAPLPSWASRSAAPAQQWASAPAAPAQQQWASAPAAPAPAPQQWASAPAQQQWASAPAAPARSQWASAPAAPAQQQWASAPAAPAQQQWASAPAAPTPAPQRWSAPADPTPAPHRYFPPGKLSLNRSPDGFSFSFNKS